MFTCKVLSIFAGAIFFIGCGKSSNGKSTPSTTTSIHLNTNDGTCAQTTVEALQALSLEPLEQTSAGTCPDEITLGGESTKQYAQCPYTLENGLKVLVVVYETTYSAMNNEYYDNKGADKAEICEDWSNEIPELGTSKSSD